MVAVLALAQVNIAFAACQMDRGTMAQAMASQPAHPCGDCETPLSVEVRDVVVSGVVSGACVAHCTADLQVLGASTLDSPAVANAPVLILPHASQADGSPPGFYASPAPRAIPSRVLLHSYLI